MKPPTEKTEGLLILPKGPMRGAMMDREDDEEEPEGPSPALVKAVAEFRSAQTDDEAAAALQNAIRLSS